MGNQTKERLVEAALALFAEKGYRSTTIQDIAAKAGTNVASINYHFRSKANFYAEVVLTALEFEDVSSLQVEPTADNAEQLLYEFSASSYGNYTRKMPARWSHRFGPTRWPSQVLSLRL